MEAQAAFGNAGVYVEKYIDRPRHVEVQVIADQHENVLHLWERDCSAQRRHQKLIEESPAPNLPDRIRTEICAAAVRMIRKANYTNAGTVEFIVDQEHNFYFIEVNARIQVEHPVTEMVTGVDLIKAQIAVAAGEPLPIRQESVESRGVAIECRINAENPEANFQPCPGTIERLITPGGFGVRWDSHVHQGYTVPPYYDSMIGKLIVHQPTRAEAIACMQPRADRVADRGNSHHGAVPQPGDGPFGFRRGVGRHRFRGAGILRSPALTRPLTTGPWCWERPTRPGPSRPPSVVPARPL